MFKFKDYEKMSDKELEQIARKYNLRGFLDENPVLTDDRKLGVDFIINRKDVIKQLSQRDNRHTGTWSVVVASFILLISIYPQFANKDSKTTKEINISQSTVTTSVVDDNVDLRNVTTKQFLQMVSSASDANKVRLYKAHAKLSLEVDTIMTDHLVGNDYVHASQASLPYLVNKYGWAPIPAGDMLIWTILKGKAILLTEPELWKVSCGQNCPPLTENEIMDKLEKDPVFHFSKQEIQPVLVEIDKDRQR